MTRIALSVSLLLLAGCSGEIDLDEPIDEIEVQPMVDLTARFDVWEDFAPEEPATVCWNDGIDEICKITPYGHAVTLRVAARRDGTLFAEQGHLVANAAIPLSIGDEPIVVAQWLDSEDSLVERYLAAGLEHDPALATFRVEVALGHEIAAPGARAIVRLENSLEPPFVIDAVSGTLEADPGPLAFAPEARPVDVAYLLDINPAFGPYTVIADVEGAPPGSEPVCEAMADLQVYADTISRIQLRCE